jgi:DNA-binding transcriptional LysR family regulator
LRVFARTARLGSLSAAARELGLSQPSVSRILATLEREIGAVLLHRTTRAVTLSEAGTDYLARIEPLLTALEEADHAARGTGELRGVLRIALPSSFSIREIIPRLPGFLERHPALRVDLGINDQRQDLVAEGVDLALRLGTLADSSAVVRRLGRAPRVLSASPTYLQRAGIPRTPAALSGHAVILGPAAGSDGWGFVKDGRRTSVRVRGRVTCAANEGAVAAAVAGLGITMTSLWGCGTELRQGLLIRVLEDWTMDPVELHAVFTAGGPPKPAARAFVDYLAAELRRDGFSTPEA